MRARAAETGETAGPDQGGRRALGTARVPREVDAPRNTSETSASRAPTPRARLTLARGGEHPADWTTAVCEPPLRTRRATRGSDIGSGECRAGQTRAGQTVNPEFDGLFLSYRIMHISDYPPYRFGGSRIRHLLLFPPTRCARRRRVRRILGGKCYHLTKPSFEMVLQAHLSPMGINALRRGSLFLHHRAQLESILWLAQESFQPIAVRCFSSTSRSRTLVSDDDVT